ncbi:MAG: AAA family ATPase [Burkholderiales bacterium]|nr:MAG: AAA family ATPase [Burkholderiales bacterium]
MKLDRLVLVNWGQLPPGDYELGNMTLLTGPTGAGKSTMLDALQTVMTASYQGIVAYNPGQEETHGTGRRGKTKRTLESFICGAEYSLFSRPDGAHGCVAAVFRPEDGETTAKPFTAVVAAAARVDGQGERRVARLERLELIIVDEEALGVADFLKDAQQSEWVAVEDLVKRLKARYRKVTSFDSHKKDYLCALYGRFRGRTSVTWDETSNAAKAWSQSIAYKPIGSVHDLVRDDILEFDGKLLQESISRISELMRQVTNLREEGERLTATVTRLKELKAAIDDTASSFEEQVQYDLLLARVHLRDDDARIDEERRKIAKDAEIEERNLALISTLASQWDNLDRSRVQLAASLQGIAAHGVKERLEVQLRNATGNARKVLDDLAKGLRSAANLDTVAQQLAGKEIPKEFNRLLPAVEALASAYAKTQLGHLAGLAQTVHRAVQAPALVPNELLELCEQFEGLNGALADVFKALVGPLDSVLMAIAADDASLQTRISAEQKTVRDLAAAKANMAGGGGNYDPATTYALKCLRQELPEASALVLCDLVEPVANTKWQPAIEAYMSMARLNFIVKPEWEARTIDFLHSINSKSRVIQGKLCMRHANPANVPRDSMIHELQTNHPIARAYLVDQWGGVVKVANSEELREVSRGITIDGKASGSRTMYPTEFRELVFGRAARENALQRTIAQLEAAEKRLDGLQKLHRTLGDVRTLLATVKEPNFDPDPLLNYAVEIDQAQGDLNQLDLTEVNDLETRLTDLQRQLAAVAEERKDAENAIALANDRTIKSEDAIKTVQGRRDDRLRELERQIGRLKQVCELNPERTYTVLSEQVTELLAAVVVNEVMARRETLRSLPAMRIGEVRERLGEHQAAAKTEERFQIHLPYSHEGEGFDPCYGPLVQLGRAVGSLHADLEGVGLYNNRNEVGKAERSFHDVFTKQFCVEIKAKVDDGVRTLRHMNAELQNLKFGTDRFTIDWSKWEPEFEDYYGFFKAVAELADSPDTVDLFAETTLTDKHQAVRDRLVKLLLDKDQERAERDLLRIADYRNYRRYEIWNESDSGGRIALSTWGTGSGGQLETPAYIVRAAVVTNRMKLFDKGPSMKLLVSDESFSRMDELRARAVLRYLRDNLGLQLISAMPTRGAGGLRPEFDREFSYSRAGVDAMNGELDFIIECDERHFKRDRMREMWDAHREKAREQARLAFDAKEPPPAQVPQPPAGDLLLPDVLADVAPASSAEAAP